MGTLDFDSDNLFELRGPVDIATNTAFGVGSVANVTLFDTALDCRVGFYFTVTTADALSAATAIFVQDRTPFTITNSLSISLDDGTEQAVTVTALPGSDADGEITITALTDTVAKGNTVKIRSFPALSTFITLDNWDGWETGMNMQITQHELAPLERITGPINRNSGSGYVLLSGTLGIAVTVGSIVKRKIGPDIAVSSFGVFPTSNPVIGDPAWGFRGVIIYDHPEIELGMRLRGEIRIADSTSGTALTRKAVSTYINK